MSESDDTDPAENPYPYYKMIKTPAQLNMGSGGNKINKNIKGLQSYSKLMVQGGGPASVTGGPLGNKYFLETDAQCKEPGGELVTRSVYINNIPDGSVPLLSSMTGQNFKKFRGLIPGMIGDIAELNPMNIVSAITTGSEPECTQLTMPVVDNNNHKSEETHYVTKDDISAMNACWFPDKKNPITGTRCSEGYKNILPKHIEEADKDHLGDLYISGLTLLSLYIFYKLYEKS